MILTQCLYYADAVSGVEYGVDRLIDDSGQAHDTVNSAPYGTALLSLLGLDCAPLLEIVKIGAPFFPVETVEDFAQKRASLRWALEQTEALLRRLPDTLRLYRARAIHLIATCMQPSGGNAAMLRAARNGELRGIYAAASQTAQLCGQLQRLFQEDLFAADSRFHTPALRTQRIFEILGAEASSLFALASLPFEPYILDIPGDGPTLCMLLQLTDDLRPLAIVMLADLLQGRRPIARCGYCGRPFMPVGKAVYCDRVQDREGNTCKQLGAMARYQRTLEQNASKRAYRQAYKRQFSRMRSGWMDQAAFDEWRKQAKHRLGQIADAQQEEAYLTWLADWKPEAKKNIHP